MQRLFLFLGVIQIVGNKKSEKSPPIQVVFFTFFISFFVEKNLYSTKQDLIQAQRRPRNSKDMPYNKN